MPGMLGPELAERLAAERPQVRAIFMSGFDRGALSEDVAAAVHDVIDKPFTPGVLLRRVRGALDAP